MSRLPRFYTVFRATSEILRFSNFDEKIVEQSEDVTKSFLLMNVQNGQGYLNPPNFSFFWNVAFDL